MVKSRIRDGLVGILSTAVLSIPFFSREAKAGEFKPYDLLVTSFHTDNVLQYDGITGDFLGEFVKSNDGGLDGPYDLTFGPNGDLYVTSQHNKSVKRYNGKTGEFIDTFVESGGGGLTLFVMRTITIF